MEEKIWTRDFIAWVTANTFVAINFYLLMTSMAVFAMSQFQAAESRAGLAAGLFVIGAIFMRIIAGKMMDLLGRKKLLYAGAFLFFLSSVAYLMIQSLAMLYLVRFAHGIAFGLLSNALMTIAVSSLPARRKGEGTGYLTLSMAAAMAIGPLLAINLIAYSYDWLFTVSAAVSFLAAAILMLGKVEERELSEEERQKLKTSWRFADFIDIRTLPISLILAANAIVFSSVMMFLNAYAKERQLMDAASLFFVVYAAMLFVARPLAGKLMDRRGENIVTYPAMLLFAVSFLFLAWAHSGWVLLLAAVLLAFGFGTLYPGMQMIVTKVSPPHRLGLALSTFFICLDTGTGVGGYIIGFIAEWFGFQTTFLMLAAVVLCVIPVYYYVHGRKAGKTTQSAK